MVSFNHPSPIYPDEGMNIRSLGAVGLFLRLSFTCYILVFILCLRGILASTA